MRETDIETILFDLDGTLCEYQRTAAEVVDIAFEKTGVDPFFTTADWRTIMSTIDETDTYAEFRVQCFEALADKHGCDAELACTVAAAYIAEREHAAVRFLPGAEAALETLATEYQLGLVTNGWPETQRPKLEHLAITDMFDTIVFAGVDTPSKPDPAPFHHALDRLGATPQQAVHIGNSLETDIAGAQAVGIRTVWLRGNESLDPEPHEPDYTLTSLQDLRSPPWQK